MIPIYKQKELRTELYKNEVTVCRLLAITYKFNTNRLFSNHTVTRFLTGRPRFSFR